VRPCLLLLAAALLAACGTADKASSAVVTEPQSFDGAECAVCGMTVADQASPRGQAQHRDGGHVHFCSVGDLAVYLESPGPAGPPLAVWVEALPLDLDPVEHDVASQPWIAVEDAVFVLGDPRRVMGTPVLSYASGDGIAWSALKDQLRRTGKGTL